MRVFKFFALTLASASIASCGDAGVKSGGDGQVDGVLYKTAVDLEAMTLRAVSKVVDTDFAQNCRISHVLEARANKGSSTSDEALLTSLFWVDAVEATGGIPLYKDEFVKSIEVYKVRFNLNADDLKGDYISKPTKEVLPLLENLLSCRKVKQSAGDEAMLEYLNATKDSK